MNQEVTQNLNSTDRRRRSVVIAWSITAAAGVVAFAAGVGPPTTAPSSLPGTTSTARTVSTSRATTATAPVSRPTSAATTTTAPLPPTTGRSGIISPPSTNVNPLPPQQESIDPEVKYWMAFLAGQRLHDALQQGNAGADDYNVMQGFMDGVRGRQPAYGKDEIEDRIARMQMMAAAKHAESLYAEDPNFRHKAEENLQKSRAAIEQFSQLEGTETRIDGVLVRVLDAGNGRVVGNAKSLTMRVRVELSDGSLVRGTDPNQNVTLPTADLLPDLMESLRGMKVNGHWRVLLPPDRAYGLAGKPPLVGPNEALMYDIVLTGVQ